MSLLLSRKRQKALAAASPAPLPRGWRRLPAADLRALAQERSGRQAETKAAALEILEEELKHGECPL